MERLHSLVRWASYGKHVSLLLHAIFGAALDAQENCVLMLLGLHGSVPLLMGFLLFFLHPIVNGVAARYGLKIL
jgi:hypothetical protein